MDSKTFAINPAASTTTFGPAPMPTFPGPNSAVSASNNSTGTITYSYVSGPCAFVSGATFSSTGTGVCTVRADSAATANYLPSFATQGVTITPPLTTTGTLIVIKHVINDSGGTALAGNFWLSVGNNGASPASFWGSEAGTSVNDGPKPRRVHHAGDGDRDDDHDGYCDDFHAHDHDGGDDHDGNHDGHDDHGDDHDGHHDGDHDDDDDNPVIYIGSFSSDCSGTILAGQTKTSVVTNNDFRFVTYTQGAWGASPKGNNAGALLANRFAAVYAGCNSGNLTSCPKVGGSKAITFSSPMKINNFLPAGGNPNKLSSNATDPTSTNAGVFAGQVLALRLNVDFSNAGFIQTGLVNLHVAPGNKLAGQSVSQVLATANAVLGGGSLPAGISSIGQLNDLLTRWEFWLLEWKRSLHWMPRSSTSISKCSRLTRPVPKG